MKLLSCLSPLLMVAALPVAAQTAPDTVLILDASGSMWGRIQNEPKIAAARRVVKKLVGGMPAGARVGLIAYGHRRKGDCADIETLLPPGNQDKAAIGGKLDALNPVGMTPITKSFEEAVAAVKGKSTPSTVVLVTDGLETCGGDPCRAARAAREAGVNFVLHVVGFDVGKENVSQLECMAQAGGGMYIPAEDADALSAALEKSVAPPAPAGDSKLSVKVVADGKLHDATVTVREAGGTRDIAGGRTYTSAETNPRIFPLPAGRYDVTVQVLALDGEPRRELKGLALERDRTNEQVLDFSSGELSIGIMRNGAPSDATVTIYPSGTRRQVAGGRTYRAASSNPKLFRLTPGEYDVEVKPLEIAGAAPQRLEKVTVEPGKRAARSIDLRTGTLQIGAAQGGALVDAAVQVRGAAGPVGGGRTYTAATSNPKSFELLPGIYEVTVTPVRVKGTAQKFAIEVKAGETARRVVEF